MASDGLLLVDSPACMLLLLSPQVKGPKIINPLTLLHDFTLFVIDLHQKRSISLFPTPFDHFQYCPDGLYSVWMILTLSGQCQNGLDDFNTARTVLILSGLKITFSLFGCMTLVGSWVTS